MKTPTRGGRTKRPTPEEIRAIQAEWMEKIREIGEEAHQLQREGLPFEAAKEKLGKDLVRFAQGHFDRDFYRLMAKYPPASVQREREAGRKHLKSARDGGQTSHEAAMQRARELVPEVQEMMRQNPRLSPTGACKQVAKKMESEGKKIHWRTLYRHWKKF